MSASRALDETESVRREKEEKGDWWPRTDTAEQPIQNYGTGQPAALIPVTMIAILVPRLERAAAWRTGARNTALSRCNSPFIGKCGNQNDGFCHRQNDKFRLPGL